MWSAPPGVQARTGPVQEGHPTDRQVTFGNQALCLRRSPFKLAEHGPRDARPVSTASPRSSSGDRLVDGRCRCRGALAIWRITLHRRTGDGAADFNRLSGYERASSSQVPRRRKGTEEAELHFSCFSPKAERQQRLAVGRIHRQPAVTSLRRKPMARRSPVALPKLQNIRGERSP